ncbi:hypothetical protein M5K25_024505 [Dendrobium thyrsiflorum]|uniref:Uncharacterized protein n=1 Tax=Dendrobium thyrsiflorum TaxID=117978 RepID=A0ABD0U2K2_DENTH
MAENPSSFLRQRTATHSSFTRQRTATIFLHPAENRNTLFLHPAENRNTLFLHPAENCNNLPSPGREPQQSSFTRQRTATIFLHPAENRNTLPYPAENRYPFSPLPGEGREPGTMLMYSTRKPPEMMGRDLEKIDDPRSWATFRIINIHIGERNPDQYFLTLNPGHLLHPPVLDERRDLRGVRDKSTDLLEVVIGALLLLEPDEAGFAVVSDLLEIVQREKAARKVDQLEELNRFLLADLFSVVDLGAFSVGFDRLQCRHSIRLSDLDLGKLERGRWREAPGSGAYIV